MSNTLLTLDQFLGNKTKQSLDLGASLIQYIAQDAVNKLDVEPLTITGGDFTEIMDSSEFEIERQKLGYKVAAGEDWGMASLIINDKPFLKAMQVYFISEIANVYTEVQLCTGNLIKRENAEVPELIRFKLVNGKVIKDQGYWSNGKGAGSKWINIDDEIVYPGSWIPFRKFRENAIEHSPVRQIRKVIEQLNLYSNQILPEWNKSKLQFGNNKMFGAQKSAMEWQKALASGQDVHDFTDPDGTFQLPLTALTGATATIQHLLMQFNYLEDKALKYSFTARDTATGGTNKHNLEIATYNQTSFEYLLAKQKLRQLDYAILFKIVADQLGQSTSISVINPISELEMMKLEGQRATVAQASAQAQQMLSQATLYEAQATATAAGEAPTGEGE